MPAKKKARKPAARKPLQTKTRAMDQNAWKIFTRKAGAMHHRRAKRLAQRERRDMQRDLGDAH